MSSPQVDSTDDRQPVADGLSETSGLATSLTNRTHWLQRALSPWVQRWLSTAEGTSGRSGRPHPFASLTLTAMQHTLDRLHAQYESHLNLETLVDSSSLPLAGMVEKQAIVPDTESAAPARSRRVQGPYSRSFRSMEDFTRAVEAAKERNYAPPAPEERQTRPQPKREGGPYSRPFQSMEDFTRAIEAAKERNYGPPSSEELQPQPAPRREVGKYSRAFSSFEDFAKAVEETRSQWAPAPGEAPSVEEAESALPPQSPADAPIRVRPISRIEELPVQVETRAASGPLDLPAPPEISRSMPQPKPAPATTPTTTRAHPKAAPSAAPQPAATAASPQLQRSSLETSFDSSRPEDEVEPEVQRSLAPTLQRREVPVQAEPEDLTVGDNTESTAIPELDQVVQRLSQPATPPVNQPVAMPLVQRQTAASEALEEASLDEEPLETDPPIAQRQAAIIQRRSAENFAVPSSEIEEPSDQTEESIVQRRVISSAQPESTPSSTRPDMPLVQRHAAVDETEPEETEESSASDVQRKVAAPAESANEIDEPEEAVQRSVEAGAPAPTSVQLPAAPEMPLVQRKVAAPSESAAEIDEPEETVQRSVEAGAPTPTSVQLPATPEMPLVQRKSVTSPESAAEIEEPEETVQRSVEASVPAPTSVQLPTALEMPLVQRKAAAPPESAAEIEEPEETMQRKAAAPPESAAEIEEPEETVQRSVEASVPAPRPAVLAPQLVQPGEKKIVAPLTDSKLPPAPVAMPLVQRQTAEAELEPPDLGAVETAPAAETVSADEVVPLEDTDTAETVQRKATPAKTLPRKAVPPVVKPVSSRVQRHAAEVPKSPGDEAQAIPSALADTHAPLDMPFVQRQPLEGNPAVVQRSVVTGESETEAATAQPAFDLSERILSRVAPPERRAVAKPVELPLHHTTVQRESLPETAVADRTVQREPASVSRPVESLVSVASAAPFAVQRTAEPVVQRTPAESATSSPGVGFIQRVESVPAATEKEAEAAAETSVDLDNLARQVYPIIKRLIAVERERRAFR